MRAGIALLVVLSLATSAGVAQAQNDKADPSKLWKEYPLAPDPVPMPDEQPAPPAVPTITNAPVIQGPAEENRISGAAAIAALFAGALVLVTLIFFATRFLTDSLLFAASATVKGVPAVSKLFRRHNDDDEATPPEDDRLEAGSETGRPVADMVTSYTAYRSTVAAPAESEAPAKSAAPDESAARESSTSREPVRDDSPGKYADLGQRIADVLRVAEESSEQVLADAQSEADRIREEAVAAVQDMRGRAEKESKDRLAETERLRVEVEEYVEERRRAADEQAAAIRAEAETEARAMREAGEEIRRRLEQEGIAKQQQLHAATTAIETRLREAMTTSLSVASEIKVLLNGAKPDEDEDDATLAEALEVQQQRN
jgi:hypothetical protein